MTTERCLLAAVLAVILLAAACTDGPTDLTIEDRPLRAVIENAADADEVDPDDADALADLYVEHVEELSQALLEEHDRISREAVQGALAVIADHDRPLDRVWRATQQVIAETVAEILPIDETPLSFPLEQAAVLALAFAEGLDQSGRFDDLFDDPEGRRPLTLNGTLLEQSQSLLPGVTGAREDALGPPMREEHPPGPDEAVRGRCRPGGGGAAGRGRRRSRRQRQPPRQRAVLSDGAGRLWALRGRR